MPKQQQKNKTNERGTRKSWVWALLAVYLLFMALVAWQLLRDRGPTPPDQGEFGEPVAAADAADADTRPSTPPPDSPTSPQRPNPDTVDTTASPTLPGPPPPPPPPPPPTFPERPLNRGPSGLTKELNAADKTIDEDIDLLNEVFVSFRTGLKGGNPVGTNREITRALTGRNKMRLVWVDPAHPAINDKGELCDRWGTPFFFHQESAHAMGVRSAGPDQEMYTEDDTLFEPPQRGPNKILP